MIQTKADEEEVEIQRVDLTCLSAFKVCAHPSAPHASAQVQGSMRDPRDSGRRFRAVCGRTAY